MSTATRRSTWARKASTGAVARAFLRRDWAIMRSYRFPFVVDTVFGLLQLLVYVFLSRTFEGLAAEQLNGAPSYFAFAAVGMILALVIEAATQGVSAKVRDGQLSGSLETLMSQPLRNGQLCAGLTAFPFAFAIVRGAVYLTVAALWMELDVGRADLLGFVLVFLMSGAALATLGIVAGAAVLVFKRGELLVGAGIFTMTLVSGSVFPVSSLPDWLETAGSVSPLRFAFDGARDALFLGSGWGPEMLGLIAYTLIGLPIAIWLFGRALTATRRSGSVGQY